MALSKGRMAFEPSTGTLHAFSLDQNAFVGAAGVVPQHSFTEMSFLEDKQKFVLGEGLTLSKTKFGVLKNLSTQYVIDFKAGGEFFGEHVHNNYHSTNPIWADIKWNQLQRPTMDLEFMEETPYNHESVITHSFENAEILEDGLGFLSSGANGSHRKDCEEYMHKRPHMGEVIQSSKKHCGDSSRKPKHKVTPSKDPQSVAAKNRRERISERLKVLQDLVPNGSKVDLVTMLEKAINYVKFLQLQVKVLATDEFWPTQGGKAPEVAQVKDAIEAILSSHISR